MFPIFNKIFDNQQTGWDFLKANGISYRYASVIKSYKRLYNPQIYMLKIEAIKRGISFSDKDFLWREE